jgi:hypothetical protein
MESTKIWYTEDEVLSMIQNTLKNLPGQAFRADRGTIERKLINDLEEVLTAYKFGQKSHGKELLKADLALISDNIREDMIGAPVARLSDLCRDLADRL